MSFLRGSTNYVWCTTSVLGKGATGAVFLGVNRHNGETVAVKTFNQMSHYRPVDVQMREFEVLRKVNHVNIVKLLAIEDDHEGRGKVIVMELCTGGSLFNILDDPENTYGLPPNEFRLVLDHLSAGIKHLRDNNLVHRDLKPGNIMKFISEDGIVIYKLTDFGAARELEDNQAFVSLYGTEEYLHPDMYERAVLRKSITKTFTANVDLWSIGVTLYHVATGNLPFRPFGGRKNKETMHRITTKKAAGCISGQQLTEDGPIEWSNQLPAHCQLSAGLKMLLIPLLAGLLEDTKERMWPFDRFFKEVTNILSKRVLHIYHINRSASIEVYLDENDTYYNVKEHIQLQTEVATDMQILLLDSQHLDGQVGGVNSLVKGYPETTAKLPIFLYNIDNNNVVIPSELELPQFPVFSNTASVENDVGLAKVCCSVGHECKRRIENYSHTDRLIKLSVDQFIIMLRNTFVKLLDKTQHLEDMAGVITDLADVILQLSDDTEYAEDMTTVMHTINALKGQITSVSSPTQHLYRKFVTEESLNSEWKSAIGYIKCPCRTRANERGQHLIERLRDSWQHLLRDRATRSLTYNDEQFHALEKIKIGETGKRIKLLLNDVRPIVAQIAECLADWYKRGQTTYLTTQILEKDIDTCDKRLSYIREHLYRIREHLQRASTPTPQPPHPPQLITTSNSSSQQQPQQQNVYINNKMPKDLQNLKVDICNYQREIQDLLRENADLVKLIQNLALGNDDPNNSIDHSRL